MSEDSGPKGSGVCWRLEMTQRADKYIKEHGLDTQEAKENAKADREAAKLMVDNAQKEWAAQKKSKNPTEENTEELVMWGYVATRNNIDGSVALACYAGSIDGGVGYAGEKDRLARYSRLVNLHRNNPAATKRISKAYNFGLSMRNKFPLDVRGEYRVRVCDQMVIGGKL